MHSAPALSSHKSFRICSLVPGATEIVVALGLADRLVGVSHECDFPPEITTVPVLVRPIIDQNKMESDEIDRAVGRAVTHREPLYRLDEARFLKANPDLVITQDLCHVCAVTPSQLHQAIRSLPNPPSVIALHAASFDDVLSDIQQIGNATGTEAQAEIFLAELRQRLARIRKMVETESTWPTVACLEWLDPLYAAGHWVPEMVHGAGGRDVLSAPGIASERIAWHQLVAANPDVLIIMPCGFSIERTRHEIHRLTCHPQWNQLPAVRHGRVFIVDAGSYFSRPGPRLVQGVEILAALCHPSRFDHIVPAGAYALDDQLRSNP